MERLAVFGWDDALRPLLVALERRASLRAVVVGDARAAQLVRARSATGLPCYQHLLQMAQSTTYDVALISAPGQAVQIADCAAERSADLLITGDRMDGETLEAVAGAAVRQHVALAVLRPALRGSGSAFVAGLVASDARWRPQFAHIEIAGDRGALLLLRDGIAAAVALLPDTPLEVVASSAASGTSGTSGTSGDEPQALSVHLRCAGGTLITLSARTATAPALRLSAAAEAGEVQFDSNDEAVTITIRPAQGASERSHLPRGDVAEAEATRVAAVRRGEHADALIAFREAATLLAVQRALISGQPEAVRASPRAVLRVIGGNAAAFATPPAGHLHLVGADRA